MLNRIKKLRGELVTQHPLFGLLAYATEYELANVPTACTDGIKIQISEVFFSSLLSVEAKMVLAHELLHIALLHHCRRGQRNAKLWDIAADYVINLQLVDYGFSLPEGCLIDEQYRDMSTEKVYSTLYSEMADDVKKDEKKKDGKEKETGQKSQSGDNKSDSADTNNPSKSGETKLDKLAKQCEKMGTVTDCPEESKEKTEEKVKQLVEQSVILATARGNDPGGMKTRVARDNQLQVHYVDRIRELLQRSTENRTSYDTLDESYASRDIFLPGYSGTGGRVGILIDTSVSINKAYLSQFVETIAQLMEELALSQVVLIQGDSKVRAVDENYDGSEFDIVGGGGTSFQPLLDEAEEHNLDCVVYLSDLYGNCPQPPSYPLLWVKWGRNTYHDDFPGEVVGMEIER